ncbi:MAG: trehalose-phosphatase [Rhizobiaceae bacterium]|nr:trehalose-phosphatase [Rhizobiaceae bacterium]MCV0408566.1 trehalose-phosphatase [Rhizobiaceae bacterium]
MELLKDQGEAGRGDLPASAAGLALFLDIDGTLVDIAPTPDAVAVEPGLAESLGRLASRLDGAVALVTGRPIEAVDALFDGLRLPVSGLHGAEWRDTRGDVSRPEPTDAFLRSRERLRRAVAGWEGVVFEDKGVAFAAHWRLAPLHEKEIRELMRDIAAKVGEGWTLQAGKCVLELRPKGRDKGDALTGFMAAKPFAGRRPLAIGDDVTDEAMFAAANAMGGLSVRVGDNGRPTVASGSVASPAVLRRWITGVAA